MARYIDADKMQEFIEEQNDINDWLVSQYNADWISSFVENQPTADVVELKHGYWIKAQCSEKNGDAHCSECNYFDWSDCKYCSECGARMDGECK